MIASPAERGKIEVVNVDQWVKGILRRFGYRPELLFDERRRREFWNRALTRKPDDVDYHDSFYRAEFERVVLSQGCESAEDCMKASRIGRGKQLSRLERAEALAGVCGIPFTIASGEFPRAGRRPTEMRSR